MADMEAFVGVPLPNGGPAALEEDEEEEVATGDGKDDNGAEDDDDAEDGVGVKELPLPFLPCCGSPMAATIAMAFSLALRSLADHDIACISGTRDSDGTAF